MLSTHDFILVLNLLLKEISSQVLTHAETISTADLNPVEQLNADTGMQEHVNSSVLEGIAHFVVAYQEWESGTNVNKRHYCVLYTV